MSSMFDMFIEENIMITCENFFNSYLDDEDCSDDRLTEDERNMVRGQVGYVIGMIERIWKENESEEAAHTEIIDKLIGMCIVSKMNEARFCRLLNKKDDKDGDV
jgi:hypothetical protein